MNFYDEGEEGASAYSGEHIDIVSVQRDLVLYICLFVNLLALRSEVLPLDSDFTEFIL